MSNVTDYVTLNEPISGATFKYLGFAFKLVLNPALGVMGICANVINMAVFYKMGLSDGVTQNFFILSASDFLISLLCLTNSVAYILETTVYMYGENSGSGLSLLHAQSVYWATFVAVTFPQNFSLVTTVVIAVVRCCCVAMPLRVKYLITARRQMAAILLFSGCAALILLLAFSPMRIVHIREPYTNASYAIFAGSQWYTYTVFTNVFFYSGFIIVIVCVCILTASLNKSSRFRESSATSGSIKTATSAQQTADSRRDTRVVKTVVLVSAVFIVCYLPPILFPLLRQFIDEFIPRGRLRNVYLLFLMMNESFLLLNTDANMIIYYLFNTRYHDVCKDLLRPKRQ